VSAQGFLASAHRIGRSLCRDALWAGPAGNWLGWTARPIGGQLVIGKASQSAGLAHGTAGIGLFLAQLHAHTSEAIIKTTSRAAFQHAIESANLSDSGFFTGCAGIACAIAEASDLLNAREYKTHACRLFGKAMEALPPKHSAGKGVSDSASWLSAGGIPMLLAVGRRQRLKCAIDLAVQIGERLAEITSLADPDLINPPAAAMIASALGELAATTGQHSFKLACDRLLNSIAHDHLATPYWPADNPAAFPDLYCETAAPLSILYAQVVRAANLHPDNAGLKRYAGAIADATAVSLTRPLTVGDGGYCLSHGVAGKAEVLLLAASLHERADLLPLAAAAGQSGVTHFSEARMPWPCAVPAGESPNLMFGLAGIGYFYLRLHDPAAVPSLLA
jgi:lantibiotic modifying enzyme